MERINNVSLKKYTGLGCDDLFECDYFGMANAVLPNTIAFIDEEKYVEQLNSNKNIEVVICTEELRGKIHNKTVVFCDDPRYDFYTFYNEIIERNAVRVETEISSSAIIDPKAHVSDYNVKIGPNTYVGPNASILPDVEIGSNCYIKAGAVVGSEGFELKRTKKGIINVLHDGKVFIGNDVKIGANTIIHKGFSFRHTVIADDVKVDDLVYIAHSAHIGKGCFLIGNCMISGSATLKENIWVGPGVTISNGLTIGNNAYLTIGSVVTKDVKDGGKVTGNFAIPHETFMKNLKKDL
tara:strand:+ start:1306 stop:2190 length:885 start_codon:yes stop_codon:yes gene_type:complete